MPPMKKSEKNSGRLKNTYYFGGPVPREVQEGLESCRDRGMTVQTIARKLAYLWLALGPEKQNQLYFSMIDVDYDEKDKSYVDLFSAIDSVIIGQILSSLPRSAELFRLAAEIQKRQPKTRQKKNPVS